MILTLLNAINAAPKTTLLRLFFLLAATLAATARVTSALQIGPLLSTCVDACQRGCTEIRRVHEEASRGTSADGSSSLKVKFKDAKDPRTALTEADCAAQRAIVTGLRSEWGSDLRIVGEEDDDDNDDNNSESSFDPLKRDLFDDDIGETAEIDPSEVTIFVDPLDGTREFVEGRLENCQVLVGVAIGGESVAGAIGIPFPAGDDLTKESTIVYGLADMGSGVVGETLTRGPFPLAHNVDGVKLPRPHIATGDNSHAVMTAAKKGAIQMFGGSNVVYGGAGNKILAAALGEVACSIQHKVGGPWDLCAPQAILKAMGGQMTDLFGQEIDVYRPDSPERGSEKGYLASAPGAGELFHDKLVAAMLALPEVHKYREDLNEI